MTMHTHTVRPEIGDIIGDCGGIGNATDPAAMNMAGLARAEGWWHELICHDSRAAVSFYGRVLGWRFEEMLLDDGSRYHLARQDGRAVCGVLQLDPRLHGDLPDHWMSYMRTPDIEAALRATSLAGGEILRAPAMVPSIGRLALIADAGGAILGLVEVAGEADRLADDMPLP